MAGMGQAVIEDRLYNFSPVDRFERGHVFAQANCAACHAIGRDGESPRQSAPPLRTLHRRYPVEFLTEALAQLAQLEADFGFFDRPGLAGSRGWEVSAVENSV